MKSSNNYYKLSTEKHQTKFQAIYKQIIFIFILI